MRRNPPLPDRDRLVARNRELTILNTIARTLNASTDESEALEAALTHVIDLLDLRTGWILLIDEDTAEPYLAAARHLPPGLEEDPRLMEGGCYCLDTFRSGDLDGAANINVIACSRLRKLTHGTEGFRVHASIPLTGRSGKLGVMNVAATDWREITGEQLSLLQTISDLVAITVERTRLYDASVQLGAAEERNRLAREIHDTLAQSLTGLAVRIETADAILEDEPTSGVPAAARAREILGRALEETRRALEDVRRSVLDLRAAPLEGRTLAGALEDLVAGWRDGAPGDDPGAHPEVRFEAEGPGRRLPARVETGVYRIAREALENAGRHAAAGTVSVHLATTPVSVTLTVSDDGRGFDSAVPADRFGLQGMTERARLLGGVLHVETEPGTGTRIVAEIPLGDPR